MQYSTCSGEDQICRFGYQLEKIWWEVPFLLSVHSRHSCNESCWFHYYKHISRNCRKVWYTLFLILENEFSTSLCIFFFSWNWLFYKLDRTNSMQQPTTAEHKGAYLHRQTSSSGVNHNIGTQLMHALPENWNLVDSLKATTLIIDDWTTTHCQFTYMYCDVSELRF